MHHYVESGLLNVWLEGGYQVIQDDRFGLLLSIHDVDDLDRAITIDILRYGGITGLELVFLRKHFSLSQNALASHLGLPTRLVISMELNDTVCEESEKICDFFLSLLDIEGVQLALEKPDKLIYKFTEAGWINAQNN